MERLDISLNKGIRRSPGFTENGELSECVNIYPRGGELKNIPPMSRLKDGAGQETLLPDKHTLVGMHQTDGKTIYISKGVITAFTVVNEYILTKDEEDSWSIAFKYELDEDIDIQFETMSGSTLNIVIITLEKGDNIYALDELQGFSSVTLQLFLAQDSIYEFEASDMSEEEFMKHMVHEVPGKLTATVTEPGKSTVYKDIEGYGTTGEIEVLPLGRMIVVKDSEGLNYMLWKDSEYIFLGTEVPSLPVNFGLRGEVVTGALSGETDGSFDLSGIADPDPAGYLPDDSAGHVRTLANQAYGQAARLTTEAARDGFFTHSFFVRYALRLYDNTRVNISSPVLMTVSTNELFMESQNWHDSDTDVYYSMIQARLDYYIQTGVKERFEQWGDIVKGVDIYVSAPIYTYKADSVKLLAFCYPESYTVFSPGNINTMKEYYGYTVSRLTNIDSTWETAGFKNNYYVKRDMMLCHALSVRNDQAQSKMAAVTGDGTGYNALLQLEPRRAESLQEDYHGEGPYYLLRSYDIAELVEGERTVVAVSGDRLLNIVTQETLKETQSFGNIVAASDAMVYNRRLNLSDAKIEMRCMQSLETLLPRANRWQDWECDATTGRPARTSDVGTESYRLMVETVSPDGKTIRLRDQELAPEGTSLNLRSALQYLFYPDSEVTKMAVFRWEDITYGSTPVILPEGAALVKPVGILLPGLKKSFLINGTYYKGDVLSASAETDIETSVEPTDDNVVSYPNRLLLSEVEDPFVYTMRNEYMVGNGRIMKLATNTEPLSTGQYGQFPLIAFCTDGTWALSVNADGTFDVPRPLSRDVLTNTRFVIGVDRGLLFVTRQGLKLLGADKRIQLLSAILEGENTDETMFVGGSTPIASFVSGWSSLFIQDTDEIRESLQCCSMVYDGKENIVHIFFPDTSKQLILNLDGLSFSSQTDGGKKQPVAVVEDYAMSVMQFDGDRHLYGYDTAVSEERSKGWCLSRILTMGEVNRYACVMQMKAYHRMASGSSVQTALFASNDSVSWRLLTSLKGASYRYYRFALFTDMNDLDAVSGLSILYEPRRDNKLR